MSLLLLFNNQTGGTSTIEGSATGNAVFLKTETASFVADSILLSTTIGSFTADAVLNTVVSASLAADAVVQSTAAGDFTANSVIKTTEENSFTSDAVLATLITETFTADALLLQSTAETFSADSYLDVIGRPVWTTPGNAVAVGDLTPTLQFYMPTETSADMYFMIQLDTVNTFDGGDLRTYDTSEDTTGWEYWDGDSWEPMTAPLAASWVGSEARFTVPIALAQGTWYRRVRGGV